MDQRGNWNGRIERTFHEITREGVEDKVVRGRGKNGLRKVGG